MKKLKGLLLTEGMHGMISQVEGLAKALDLDFTHHKVELNNFWKFIPPKLTPISNKVYKHFDATNYDIIISCGRKSVVPSIYLKKNSQKKIINIHIQDPKVNLKYFDIIVTPEHDGVTGDNVISSKGAIHYLTEQEISSSKDYLVGRLDNKKNYLGLIIGGPNKYYNYSNQIIERVLLKVKKVSELNKLQVIAIPSIRTPKNIITMTSEILGENHLAINEVDKRAYLSTLAISKYLVVTCDSTSMISEAAITGKPVYVEELPAKKNDYRFKKFRDLFTKLNIIKKLDKNLEDWTYKKLDETNRIAKEIKEKIY
jgi:mitochondrial fission protein ELM1